MGRVLVTTPARSDCAGLWRRALLIESDGTRDASAGVTWLQGITGYVDSRGFAGTLHQRGDVFEWHRDVDLEPPGPFPDAGSMRWEGRTLIETGVHENYVEHWVRDEVSDEPCGALFLTAPDGANGLLVRVGPQFGWARAGEVVIDEVGTSRWDALDIDVVGHQVQSNGVRWFIERSEGNVNP
jgi:hypothetical protein